MTMHLFMSIEEVCRLTGVSRTMLYREMGAGRLLKTKIGNRTYIQREDLDAWRRGLVEPSEAS